MLTAIGTIKIDTPQRKIYFMRAIESLVPVRDLFSWKINIIGQHARPCHEILMPMFQEVEITNDDSASTYELQRAQMDSMLYRGPVITWQEDHLFICPHQLLFHYLLDEFRRSGAEVLTITHLITSWERKKLLPGRKRPFLYTTYFVNQQTQQSVWNIYPDAYISGSPAIYKWHLANDILEFKGRHMSQTTLPEFELNAEEGKRFLQARSFEEIVPKFHVFREIEQEQHSEAAKERTIPETVAMSWIRKRDRLGGCGDSP